MLKPIPGAVLAAILLVGTGDGFRAAAQRAPARTLSRLPAAVQKTIRTETSEGRIVSIEKDSDDGEVTYDVEIVRQGKNRMFGVGEDGRLMYAEMFMAELAAPVQRAIQARLGGSTPVEIDRSIDAGDETYDVEFVRGGTNRTFTVNVEGALISEQVFLPELPAAVQETIRKQGGTIGEIDKSTDDGETTYDVDITRDGKARSFSVGAAGELLATQMFLNELPARLTQAIHQRVGSGKLDEITKLIDNGVPTYDVDIVEAGASRTVTLDGDGNLLGEEQPIGLSEIPAAVRSRIDSLPPTNQVIAISRIREGADVSYEVDLRQAGKLTTVSIGADGKLLPDD